ncbi:hypothetical protein [Burkholderia cepacia]|uniref:hypothetical protein n=1 Tax=Burkholderia cepacia TaxID=292 RepID=UPI0039A65A80
MREPLFRKEQRLFHFSDVTASGTDDQNSLPATRSPRHLVSPGRPQSLQAALKQAEFKKPLGSTDFQQQELPALHIDMQADAN